MDNLFSVKWRPIKFKSCDRRDEGGFECIYQDTRIDLSLSMIVEDGVSAGGYNVASVAFRAKNNGGKNGKCPRR